MYTDSVKDSINTLKLEESSAISEGDYQIAHQKRMIIENLEEKLRLEENVLFLEMKQQEFDLTNTTLNNLLLQKELERNTKSKIALIIIIGLLSIVIFGAYLLWRQNKTFSFKLQEKVKDQTQSLKIMNEQLIDNNQELKRFSHIASHDIKEPIRNIGSFIKLIRRKITPDQEQQLQSYFEIIDRSTNQIYTLVEDIMQYTKIGNKENIPTEIVNLNDMVDSIISNMSSFISSNNAVVEKISLQPIHSNNSLLFIILKNLIENGIKYNEEEVPRIKASYTKTDYGHEISVQDNGIGIVPKYRKDIFDMFTRLHTRTEYDGTGLGLSIVQSCVHRMGGVIQLKSEVGFGSKFTIILPIRVTTKQPDNKQIPLSRVG